MAAHNIDHSVAADVVAEWSEPHLPTIFSKWHSYVAEFQRAATDKIIAAAEVKPSDRVLDVGCGSGIPSLALAEAIGLTGKVVATDPSPVFIEAVKENAKRLGLSNIEAVQTSAAGLPFPAASFDAATCQLSVMFFPDVDAGLRRIREVIRPGGRAAFVAWGPATENEYFGTFWKAAQPYLPPEAMAEPPPDTPAPMRFAQPGSLSGALRAAGFAGVAEETQTVQLHWPGNAESVRDFWFELTRLDEKVPSAKRDAFRAEVHNAYKRVTQNGHIYSRAAIVLAFGQA